MKFRLTDGIAFEVGGVKGHAVTAQAGIKSGDVASLQVDGRHGRVKTTLSDRFYYVVAGSGTFHIGQDAFEVTDGDVLVVPRDTTYDFEGKMELVLFSSPAFDPTKEVFLENAES